jgi:hypothetical protein
MVLMLAAQASVALVCGWMFLAIPLRVGSTAGSALLGMAVLPLPASVSVMALYSAMARPAHVGRQSFSAVRLAVFGAGGVTHETVWRRVAPASVGMVTLGTVCAVAAGGSGGVVILVFAMGLVGAAVGLAGAAVLRQRNNDRKGMIRLASPAPDNASSFGFSEKRVYLSDDELRAIKDSSSWIESPCKLA